ncbi:bifunctional aldolase/short-chain dehydrogenase [Propionicicella superfundia]|uniref:bifunctional aldolase/short-chain dehydrogenase n=1 Tax=Propionicicella superfundia TaxID=348582 RepID=UPI0004266874|nr:bifunctional aldolase/short-chain dehydrogenase [Propionicicella superfundia]
MSRWNAAEAAALTDPVEQLAYVSRLLGSDPDLVLHGGGNTSVKSTVTDITGAIVDTLLVKGSGYDLATIPPKGFAPLRLARLRELLDVARLDDTRMMSELRCALLDGGAPDPSVEALLHAALPQPWVLHTHADAIVTLTHVPDEGLVSRVLGPDVLVVPYIMPGFDLARLASRLWAEQASGTTVGLVLRGHGLFTVGATAEEAYTRHLALVDRAAAHLAAAVGPAPTPGALPGVPGVELAALRRSLSEAAGAPLVMSRHVDVATAAFVARDDLATVTQQGPATPEHSIRTKRVPLVGTDVAAYVAAYEAYVAENEARRGSPVTRLDPAPRVVLDPRLGMLTAGRTVKDADIARDVYRHTMRVITAATACGGYVAPTAEEIFDVEYWDLEQAKLRRAGTPARFTGYVVLVTGASTGIGRACARAFLAQGAAVVGTGRHENVQEVSDSPAYLGLVADVRDADAMQEVLQRTAERFGGIDILVANAGVYSPPAPIAALDDDVWRNVLGTNLDAVARLFRDIHPYLAASPVGGRVVVVSSKNVAAPGPGVAPYSASKAAVTQLARVAALEWAPEGIRVNLVTPDAVFDTALWNEDLIASRARKYGLSVEDYKLRNLLRTEITSDLCAAAVLHLASDDFSATTGAQVPIDGGNDRVI